MAGKSSEENKTKFWDREFAETWRKIIRDFGIPIPAVVGLGYRSFVCSLAVGLVWLCVWPPSAPEATEGP
jgi:hypothetical protein